MANHSIPTKYHCLKCGKPLPRKGNNNKDFSGFCRRCLNYRRAAMKVSVDAKDTRSNE